MRYSAWFGLTLIVTALLMSPSADADSGTADVNSHDDQVDIVVWDLGREPGAPAGPDGEPVLQCSSSVHIRDDNAMSGVKWDPQRGAVLPSYAGATRYFSSTGRWMREWCYWSDDPGRTVSQRIYPEGEAVDPVELMRIATARLDPPSPSISTAPPHSSAFLVQTPTWLWLNSSYWHPYSETASTGRVSATAVATPVHTTWDMGNGETVLCDGPGVPWGPDVPVDDGCTHTYRHSSAGAPADSFDLTAAVTFDVSWSSVNAGGMGGSLQSLTRSSVVPIQVGEVQALVVAD
jgi:hypothetical protein